MVFSEKVKQLAPDDVAYVHDMKGHALWYAWGQIDAMQQYGVKAGDLYDLNDGFRFAEQVEQLATAFRGGDTYCMSSLLGLWQDYRKAKEGIVTMTVLPS
jgi:hypothetical protein